MAHTNKPEKPGRISEQAGAGSETHVEPGGDVHSHGVGAQSAAVHHEVTDIPLGGVTRAAGITIVFVGFVMLLMWGAWGFFLRQAQATDPGKPAMAAEDFGSRLPGTPRLQSVPVSDLRAYRAAQAAKLGDLAWVDQSAGTVRLPIGMAMALVVTRADAYADQQAPAPEDHSWAFPGAAQMERAGEPAAPALPEHSPSPVPARGNAAGAEQKPQPNTTAPSEQDKPQPAAPPQH
jgi:hypothetical protein